jgi:hypothetical protein
MLDAPLFDRFFLPAAAAEEKREERSWLFAPSVSSSSVVVMVAVVRRQWRGARRRRRRRREGREVDGGEGEWSRTERSSLPERRSMAATEFVEPERGPACLSLSHRGGVFGWESWVEGERPQMTDGVYG